MSPLFLLKVMLSSVINSKANHGQIDTRETYLLAEYRVVSVSTVLKSMCYTIIYTTEGLLKKRHFIRAIQLYHELLIQICVLCNDLYHGEGVLFVNYYLEVVYDMKVITSL